MKKIPQHPFADSEIMPIPYLSHFARNQLPELTAQALQQKTFGANEFAAALIPVVGQTRQFFANEGHKQLPTEEERDIAMADLEIVNTCIKHVMKSNFSTLRMLLNGMTSVKFGQKGIYYERRDLEQPANFFDACLQEFKKNGTSVSEMPKATMARNAAELVA